MTGGWAGKIKEGCSFLKKRTKKLLFVGARLSGSARQGINVFCFFFSKKKALLSSLQNVDFTRNPIVIGRA